MYFCAMFMVFGLDDLGFSGDFTLHMIYVYLILFE